MKENISQKEYITLILDRLKNNGYKIRNQNNDKERIPSESFTFIGLAKKTGFEHVRFGFFSTIFVISKSANPSISELIDYSSVSYKIAKKSTPILPPRGMMYGFGCFPFVIAEELDNETQVNIRQLDMPKHWGAFEKLVVFHVADSNLYYSERRPFWGSMYHEFDAALLNSLLYIDK